jgi:hypothetical protein
MAMGNILILLNRKNRPSGTCCLHQDGLCELSASGFMIFEVRRRHLFGHSV